MIIECTKENFNEVIKMSETVVIDFYANWCNPCRALGEEFHKFESREGLTIGKVDCDNEMELVEQFRISSIPAVFIFKNGVLVNNFIGYKSESELEGYLK